MPLYDGWWHSDTKDAIMRFRSVVNFHPWLGCKWFSEHYANPTLYRQNSFVVHLNSFIYTGISHKTQQQRTHGLCHMCTVKFLTLLIVSFHSGANYCTSSASKVGDFLYIFWEEKATTSSVIPPVTTGDCWTQEDVTFSRKPQITVQMKSQWQPKTIIWTDTSSLSQPSIIILKLFCVEL